MLNLTHSILTEESDNLNSNNNNNNSLFFHDFFVHHDPIGVENNSFHHAVYDTALFDVLKVDPEDFAVSELFSLHRLIHLNSSHKLL